MKRVNFKKRLMTIAVGGVFALGMATQAMAGPAFEVTPSYFGSSIAPFTASAINANVSQLLTLDTATNTMSGTGWLQLTNFKDVTNVSIPGGISGLDADYQLYIEYSLDTKLVSGTLGAAGSTYNITGLTYELWGGAGMDTTFTSADFGGQVPFVTDVNGNDVLLGFGSLISTSTLNGASITSGNGAGINVFASYNNTADGDLFFTDPVPFHDYAFAAVINTTQGLLVEGDEFVVNGSGTLDFRSSEIPEPVTLALLGIGLLGFGMRKQRITNK